MLDTATMSIEFAWAGAEHQAPSIEHRPRASRIRSNFFVSSHRRHNDTYITGRTKIEPAGTGVGKSKMKIAANGNRFSIGRGYSVLIPEYVHTAAIADVEAGLTTRARSRFGDLSALGKATSHINAQCTIMHIVDSPA